VTAFIDLYFYRKHVMQYVLIWCSCMACVIHHAQPV